MALCPNPKTGENHELTLSIKIAQKPYIMGSSGPKALKYESFEGKGNTGPGIIGVVV